MDPFPATRHSIVVAIRSPDAAVRDRALEALVGAYWRPIYKYLRVRWRAAPEDAEDLVQGFLARALEKGFFERYDPAQARFRTWLRTCVDGFAANEKKAAARLKRGGGTPPLPLDFESAEGELRHHDVADDLDPEAWFHREWVRSLFTLAVDELRRRCEAQGRQVHFALFEAYDLQGGEPGERSTYADLAGAHGIPVTQVNNFLAAARREFRDIVLERLREITASEAEFRQEARQLLGADPP
jgi:DNA-directed RNA polymerase specialized sigma24 family protein